MYTAYLHLHYFCNLFFFLGVVASKWLACIKYKSESCIKAGRYRKSSNNIPSNLLFRFLSLRVNVQRSLSNRCPRTRSTHLTTKSRTPARVKRRNETHDAGIGAQHTGSQGTQKEDEVPSLVDDVFGEETADVALDAVVMADGVACGWVEALALLGPDGVLLDLHAQHEQWGEGVGELHNAEGGDEARERAEVWDCEGDYVGDAPVFCIWRWLVRAPLLNDWSSLPSVLEREVKVGRKVRCLQIGTMPAQRSFPDEELKSGRPIISLKIF